MTARLTFLAILAGTAVAVPAQGASGGYQTPDHKVTCVVGNFVDFKGRAISGRVSCANRTMASRRASYTLRSQGRAFAEHGYALRNGRVLRHGQKVRVKGIVCTSSTLGMRCVNSSRHGLQIGSHSVRQF